MTYQMAQEGALWPSVMIRFGPHWHNSKITWANIVNGVLDFGTEKYKSVINIKQCGAVKNTLAQQELGLSQFGASLKSYQKSWTMQIHMVQYIIPYSLCKFFQIFLVDSHTGRLHYHIHDWLIQYHHKSKL